MKKTEENLEEGKGWGLLLALSGYLGRQIGKVIYSLLNAFITALVLAYPLKWLWNGMGNLGAVDSLVLITYWKSFKIMMMISFIIKMNTIKTED